MKASRQVEKLHMAEDMVLAKINGMAVNWIHLCVLRREKRIAT